MIKECLQIISDKGLEGLKFEEFVEILGYTPVWGSNVQCTAFKTRLWNFLLTSDKILFYCPPTDVVPDGKVHEKPQNIVDDLESDLRGYCHNYNKIKKISKKSLQSFEDSSQRYPNLHLLTTQHLRHDNFVRDTNEFIVSEINAAQFSVYEYLRRVGKYGLTSKQLTEAFSCKNAVIVFYLEFLERVAAIKLQFNTSQLSARNRGLKRENFFFHRKHQRSAECLVELMNKMMTFMEEEQTLSDDDIRKMFDKSVPHLKLVDAVEESFKLVNYFLVKLGVLSPREDGRSYRVSMLLKEGFVIEYGKPYSDHAIPKPGAHYADRLLFDEPIDLQILREIEKRGKVGLPSMEGPPLFGLSPLLFRINVKSLKRDKRIGTISMMSSKTNTFNYVSTKFLPSSQAPQQVDSDASYEGEQEAENKQKLDTTNLPHLPQNLRRLEIIMEVFEKHSALTRQEIRTHCINGGRKYNLSVPDTKTMRRLLKTLVDQGKIMLLTVTGGGEDSMVIELYHFPNCDIEVLKEKVRLHKARLDAQVSYEDSVKAASHTFISELKQFPDPIPDDMADSDKAFISSGTFFGPKTVFLQQLHLMLSVLMYRWDIPPFIPQQFKHLENWWKYILTMKPVEVQKDGSYEVKDILYHLPVRFVLNNMLRGRAYKGFNKLMNCEEYRCHCIGQLPSKLKISLSSHIINMVNATSKWIETLTIMGLAEFRCEVDYTRKGIINFKINLKSRVLLLNTLNAPMNKQKFRGFNIRRINSEQRILVYDVMNWRQFNEYWDNGKELCLCSNIKDKRSIFSDIKQIPRSLHQVLIENNIPIDQTEEFYNEKPGTVEKLDSIYSELGPAGYHFGLIFHKKLAWIDKVNLKDGGLKGFRPDLLCCNAIRNYRNTRPEMADGSDSSMSDDYLVPPKKGSGPRTITVNNVLQKKLAEKKQKKKKKKKKKRKISYSEQNKAKRVKHKFKDDLDRHVTKSKIMERARYTGEEDELIILYSICTTVSKEPVSAVPLRDYLHKKFPNLSSDKTAESARKRLNLLRKKPEIISIMADLQSKCMVYRDIYFPSGCNCDHLMETATFWSGKKFKVRSILPASFITFHKDYEIEVAGAKTSDTLTLFFPDGYRVRRVSFISIGAIKPIWDYDEINDEQKRFYQYVQIALSTEKAEYVTQEAAYKIFQEFDKDLVETVYNFACQRGIIRRQKKTFVDGKLHKERMAMTNEVLQCFYNPFPTEIISFNPKEKLYEVEYHKISAQVVSGVINMLCNPKVQLIVSGAIDPLIEKKECIALLKDNQEDEIYSQKHTKKNTFFSGISSVEEGRKLGFYLTEKQINGRPDCRMNIPISTEKQDCSMEETLGLTESMNVLPFKIFVSSENCDESLNWSRLDLDSGECGTENHTMNVNNGTTDLALYQLYEASSQNLKLPHGEPGQIAVFESFCKLQPESLDIDVGIAMIKIVFGAEKSGVPESKLFELVKNKFDVQLTEFKEILTACVGLEILIKAGLKEVIIIGKQYSAHWHIMLKSAVLNKRESSEPTSTQPLETNFEKYFPLPARPWRTMNSDFNIPLLQKMCTSVTLLIYTYPGISKQLIDEHYHAYLNPVTSRELLESLIAGDVIRRCMDIPPAASLFSSCLPLPRLEHDINNTSCFVVQENGLQNLKNFI